MENSKSGVLYKVEGVFIALLMIVMLVVFYYKIIDKYILTTMLLGLSTCLFSINMTLEQQKESLAMFKLNLFLTYLFSLATVGFSVYFAVTGCFVF